MYRLVKNIPSVWGRTWVLYRRPCVLHLSQSLSLTSHNSKYCGRLSQKKFFNMHGLTYSDSIENLSYTVLSEFREQLLDKPEWKLNNRTCSHWGNNWLSIQMLSFESVPCQCFSNCWNLCWLHFWSFPTLHLHVGFLLYVGMILVSVPNDDDWWLSLFITMHIYGLF